MSYLSVKDRCIAGRVCKQWRRIISDNSLWRHVNLLDYKLDLTKMWRILRAHFSPCLLTMRIQGFAQSVGRKRKRFAVSDAMLKELGNRCPNLSLLHLDSCNTENITVESLPSSLNSLAVTSSSWQPRWLEDKQQYIPNLKSLDLSRSTRVDNFDLLDIIKLTHLTELRLNGCYRIKGSGIQIVVKALHSLILLGLENTRIDKEAIHHIARYGKNLQDLNLAYCFISDACLVTLSLGLSKLKKLDLSGCKFTLDGLTSLWSLKNLQFLICMGVQKPEGIGFSLQELELFKKGFSPKVPFICNLTTNVPELL
ncbi:F-box/LRR-repeat protein 12-like [Elysia marginata]|uniref:F-box/LRR-repeat protein 12-like n=1 Tax=Elysia marginata TaxID=1093978 RepID=A0AAV4HX83_9GAST|nr:F-box/LRR-repeat protein 12-like [Elysia marginata]